MKNFLKYTTMLLAVLLMASCEDFLDVNEDPNNPLSVTPELVLPVAQVYTANVMFTDRYINCLGNMMMYNWSQSDGYSWYYDEFNYAVNASFYSRIFTYSYQNTLKQYQILEGLDAKYDYYKAISKIMKAYHFQLLVDLYGDIPYTEALQRGALATPKYDNATDIYAALMTELTTAIDLIKNAEMPAAVSNDVIFEGDMDSWIKFANTIKMRMIVRVSDMGTPPFNIATEIAAINTEGSGFITENVTVNPGFAKEENKQNPMWQAYGAEVSGTQTMSGKATCATDYVLAYLGSKNDPRLDRIYEKPATGHLGVPQGMLDYDTPVVDAYVPELVSNMGPGILKGFDMDAIIFTLAESKFNLAEAALKTLISDDPQVLYDEGVTASFETLGLTTADATAYLASNISVDLVGYDNSINKLQAIITQKWIALNSINAEQSWFDYTRTGYPAGLPNSLLAPPSIDRPVRIFYPASEYSSNGANVPLQPDAFSAPIFWAN
ncbi:MAG: SusD/RagB family nutrient-binding outer membrane lipoprotein [Bacteroidales bacterium]